MPLPALFGIENDAVNTVVNLLVLFLIVLWLALVFWTYKDAVRRIADPLLVTCATATSLIFPFVGTIVYLILRPPEYLDDVRERELEIAAAEARLLQLHEAACPHCGYPADKTYLRCPNCRNRLKEPCATCRKPLDPRWRICPYCESEVGQEAPQRRRRRAPAERPVTERVAGDRARSGDRVPAGPRPASAAAPRSRPAVDRQPGRTPEGRPVERLGSDGERPRGDPGGRRLADSGGQGALDEPTIARPGPPAG